MTKYIKPLVILIGITSTICKAEIINFELDITHIPNIESVYRNGSCFNKACYLSVFRIICSMLPENILAFYIVDS